MEIEDKMIQEIIDEYWEADFLKVLDKYAYNINKHKLIESIRMAIKLSFSKQCAEKDKLISELEEGISDEIDNLREELKNVKKQNNFLEERDNDFQRIFNNDKKIFKDQLKKINELKDALSEEVEQ